MNLVGEGASKEITKDMKEKLLLNFSLPEYEPLSYLARCSMQQCFTFMSN